MDVGLLEQVTLGWEQENGYGIEDKNSHWDEEGKTRQEKQREGYTKKGQGTRDLDRWKKQSALIASRQSVSGMREMGQDLFTGTNPEDYRTFEATWTRDRDSWELQKLTKLELSRQNT